jgi:AraC family transcriptional regulator
MGVCGHMDEQKGDFLYMIALFAEDGSNAGSFSKIKAPAATWAIFRSEDFEQNPCGAEIPKLFQRAYKEWLPSSGYEKAEGRSDEIYDMEVYGVTESGKFYEEVWLSVNKQQGNR